MSLGKNIVNELLNAKTEFQFIQIILRENIPTKDWRSEPNIKERYEYLKKNAGISVYDNIGYLRKKKN